MNGFEESVNKPKTKVHRVQLEYVWIKYMYILSFNNVTLFITLQLVSTRGLDCFVLTFALSSELFSIHCSEAFKEKIMVFGQGGNCYGYIILPIGRSSSY